MAWSFVGFLQSKFLWRKCGLLFGFLQQDKLSKTLREVGVSTLIGEAFIGPFLSQSACFFSNHYFHVPLSIIFVFRSLFPVFVSYVSLCSSPWRGSLSQGCSGGVGTWYPMGRTLFSGLNEQNGSNCPLNKGASSCILNE